MSNDNSNSTRTAFSSHIRRIHVRKKWLIDWPCEHIISNMAQFNRISNVLCPIWQNCSNWQNRIDNVNLSSRFKISINVSLSAAQINNIIGSKKEMMWNHIMKLSTKQNHTKEGKVKIERKREREMESENRRKTIACARSHLNKFKSMHIAQPAHFQTAWHNKIHTHTQTCCTAKFVNILVVVAVVMLLRRWFLNILV